MITLCTVDYSGCDKFIKTFLESIVSKTKSISNVLVAHIESEDYYEEKWTEGNINFCRFGHPLLKVIPDRKWSVLGNGHALGLHACIDRVNTEYTMFCDPDLFLYMDVGSYYLDLMEKYGIDFIGVSHHAATTQAFSWFPCAINMMSKTSSLPGKDFLKGHLFSINALHIDNLDDVVNKDPDSMDGYWLLQGPIREFYNKFPNPNLDKHFGLFDIGCNLWLWSLEKDWKWLSFQTTDCHIYKTGYNKSNFKFREKLKNQKLLYHLISGSRGGAGLEKPAMEKFFEKYEESREDD